MKFSIESKQGHARAGSLSVNNKTINTPAFMTIGTYGSVKTMDTYDLKKCNVEIILSNAFHLMLRPGTDLIEKVGGKHFLVYQVSWRFHQWVAFSPSVLFRYHSLTSPKLMRH